MSTRSETFSETIAIINVSSTGTATLLETLIKGALAGKSGIAASLPKASVLQIILTPSADLAVSDIVYKDDLTIASGIRAVFPIENAHKQLRLKNSATVSVELYFA